MPSPTTVNKTSLEKKELPPHPIDGWNYKDTWAATNNGFPELRPSVIPRAFAVYFPDGKPSFEVGNTIPRDQTEKLSDIMQIHYTDGRTAYKPVTDHVTLLYDFSTPGTKDITVIYRDAYGSHIGRISGIEVNEPTVIKEELHPSTQRYKPGNSFSLGGLALEITYSNGRFEIITLSNLDVTYPDGINAGNITAALGEYTLTVTPKDAALAAKVGSFPLEVIVNERVPNGLIVAIEESPLFNKNYLVGQSFNTNGLTVIAEFDDLSTAPISLSEVTFSHTAPEVFKYVWDDTVWVTINNVQGAVPYPISVTVKPDNIREFIRISEPARLNYVVGQTFDPTGFEASVTRDSNERYRINGSDLEFIFPKLTDPLEVFDTSVEAVYRCGRGGLDEEIIFNITVVPEAQDGIEIVTPPDKQSYMDGEQFDPAGMVVERVYNSGRRENITGYALSHGALSVDDFAVTVTDNGFTDAVRVFVSPIPSISLSQNTLTLLIGRPRRHWRLPPPYHAATRSRTAYAASLPPSSCRTRRIHIRARFDRGLNSPAQTAA